MLSKIALSAFMSNCNKRRRGVHHAKKKVNISIIKAIAFQFSIFLKPFMISGFRFGKEPPLSPTFTAPRAPRPPAPPPHRPRQSRDVQKTF